MIARLILCLLLVASSAWARNESDNFDRSNASPIDGDWTSVTGVDCQILTNTVQSTSNVYSACNARFTRFLPLADQTAGFTIVTLDAGWVGVLLRASASQSTFYAAGCTPTFTNIWKLVDNSFTYIDEAPVGCSAGDAITVSVAGSTISIYKNEDLSLQQSDGESSIGSGYCGFQLEYSSATTDSIIDNFSCTDASGGPAPSVKHRVVVME